MPIGTALHERTFPLCESLSYREWSGYYAVSSYEPHHEHEYNAIRNAAALIDISPLFKYRITGNDATRLVDRVIERIAHDWLVRQWRCVRPACQAQVTVLHRHHLRPWPKRASLTRSSRRASDTRHFTVPVGTPRMSDSSS